MKLIIILLAILINVCTGIDLPSGNFKDALEHERNKPAVDNIRKNLENNDNSVGRES